MSEAPADIEITDPVTITLDGRQVVVQRGALLIDACERNGVYIPRFCYHPRMRPVGMCRMCLVEVDTGRGASLQPSCMLQCSSDMVVDTQSDKTRKAQEGVLEFLLLNHPLDCPVCDRGGECPLQDQTVGYGPGETRFVDEKRHYEKPIAISRTVLLDRERCILCDRCTRFAKEVAGDPLIDFQDRGSRTQVNTFPNQPFASYFSGNTVQICPVGALTAEPYRFKARPWDLEIVESSCTTCSVGCRVTIQSSRNQVLRCLGVDSDPVNWGWLCDKGRYGVEALNAEGRLGVPLGRGRSVKTDDETALEEVSWAGALRTAADAITSALDRRGPEGVAVIGGARLTNEAQYAWVKLLKGVIGTDNLDAQLGDGIPAEIVLGLPLATIDDACRPGSTTVVVSGDPKEELPILYLRLRHAAVQDGVNLIEIGPKAGGLTPYATVAMHPLPGELADLVRAVVGGGAGGAVAGVDPASIERARSLLADTDGEMTLVVGRRSLSEDTGFTADAVSVLVSAYDKVRILPALRRANVLGALTMGMAPGVLPGRVALAAAPDAYSTRWPALPAGRGLDTTGILTAAAEGRIDTLILLGADPLTDFPDRDLAERALAGARNVIAVDQFVNDSVRLAEVVLPAAGFAECAGTTTNIEGRILKLEQSTTPPGTARPDWMIAAELAAELGSDLGLDSVEQIWKEIAELSPSHVDLTWEMLSDPQNRDGLVARGDPLPGSVRFEAPEPTAHRALDSYSLRLVATRKLYDEGTMVGRCRSCAGLAEETALAMNPHDFERLGVEDGGRVTVSSKRGSTVIEARGEAGVPRNSVALVVNAPNFDVGTLIDANDAVNEVRVEALQSVAGETGSEGGS
ncbi:MAG: NADH-quinone oxidoreductase subunit G [Acidimicrobiales bacterium]|nr:MAG: NADH dehydrogenase (quinone) subunit G [Actinomycetota bacterium]MBV6510324.1 NADH-quinone oxidoreductase subunit G [Acidimicrobiales bacterium]RIK07911.1 MAG: NADH dehydrogenase (quinone) subunit G [Acidobacteriota bacterium]